MAKQTARVIDFSAPEAQPFDFAGDRHGVLLIHGFTGSAGPMRLIGEHLREQGFTVKGINLPGHGTSIEDMAHYGWQQWLQAAKEAFLQLKEKCDYVSVSGLSMGGVLSLILAEQMDVTAVAPISAPMAVQNKAMALAGPASLFIKTIAWGTDPERKKMLDQRYDYGYTGFPTRRAVDLSHLIKLARRNLFAITCPVLAVQSHGDETISTDSAEVIVNGVSSKQKDILWLDKVPHVCTISCEHQRIAHSIGRLLREAEKEA